MGFGTATPGRGGFFLRVGGVDRVKSGELWPDEINRGGTSLSTSSGIIQAILPLCLENKIPVTVLKHV